MSCICSNFPHRTTILNSGESLLLSILLRMPRRSGVFLCMEVADKQLEFFLRYAVRESPDI